LKDNLQNNCRFNDDIYIVVVDISEVLKVVVKNFIKLCSEEGGMRKKK
jgi:hypothetical protein